MTNEEKLEQIKSLCDTIMLHWKTDAREDDSYEDGKIVGRSVLAQIILETINNG
jgi:hypothetical protein